MFSISLVVVAIIAIAIVVAVIARQITEYRLERDPVVVRIKNKLAPAFPAISNVRVFRGQSSYTIDKKKIYLCVESPDGKTVYDDNMLVYVMLHELAHTMTSEIGHGPRFFDTFQALLDRAQSLGMYDPTRPRPVDYCEPTK